jgi:hypothetical protein
MLVASTRQRGDEMGTTHRHVTLSSLNRRNAEQVDVFDLYNGIASQLEAIGDAAT